MILKKHSNKSLLKFQSFICKEIKKQFPNFNNKLDEIHKFVPQNKINNLRINLFTKLNSKINWTDLLYELCAEDIFREIGKDLVIQTKLNLSILMPKDKNSLLSAHSDSWSADSPFQLNIWIPLTNAFSTNSMFLLSKKQSLNIIKKINKNKLKYDHLGNLKLDDKDFVKLNFGEILIFNPALIHGNVVNKTNFSRISLNIRLKSLFSPEPSLRNPDRKYGTYYKKFHVSENTKLALDIVNLDTFK